MFKVGDFVQHNRKPNSVGVIRRIDDISLAIVEWNKTPSMFEGHGGLSGYVHENVRKGSHAFYNVRFEDLQYTDPILNSRSLKISDFEVGQLVRMKEDYEDSSRGPREGNIGVVRRISETKPQKVGVEFTVDVVGENPLNGVAKNPKRGFYVRPDQLELL